MKNALVLEGGSLRCMFSAGVVDVFMENNMKFSGVFGISAGSLTGVNYVSNQPKRTARVNINFARDKRYYGIRQLIKKRNIFNFEFLFNKISDIYLPLDRRTFENSPCEFTAGTTCCETGETVYFKKSNRKDIYNAIIAGSSMPLVSDMVKINGKNYLDGGISVAVPYQKAIDEGYDKIVIVTTREHGFRKPMTSRALAKLYTKKYYMYPEFVKTLIDTPRMYDRQMNEIDMLEKSGRVIVIRPEKPITIARTEKNTSNLIDLYNTGLDVGRRSLEDVNQYLEL